MKSKLQFAFLILSVLAIGFVAGRFHTRREFAASLEWHNYYRELTEVQNLMLALTQLREGQQEAGLVRLETRLNGGLRCLLPWLETVRSSKDNSVFFTTTSAVKRYRAKHPFPHTDAEVARALSITHDE